MTHTTYQTSHARTLAWLLAGILFLAACAGKGQRMPMAKGAPSEVALYGDADSTVGHLLTAPQEGLPQPEPQFQVSRMDAHPEGLRLFRNVVVVQVDAKAYTHTRVRCARDVYARGQLVISIQAPSRQALRRDIGRYAIADSLLANELRHHLYTLRRHHTPLPPHVSKAMGCTLWLPEDMRLNVTGRQFAWFSDNGAPTMSNLCLYRADRRDSVMRRNLRGETDSMYVCTVPHTVHTRRTAGPQGAYTETRRGLWQMRGDAMGGPFVQRVTHMPDGQVWVAEAFLYAPGQNKRDKLRLLEAALLTLQPTGYNRYNTHNSYGKQ